MKLPIASQKKITRHNIVLWTALFIFTLNIFYFVDLTLSPYNFNLSRYNNMLYMLRFHLMGMLSHIKEYFDDNLKFYIVKLNIKI